MRPSQLRGAAEVLSPSQDALAAGAEESEQPTPGSPIQEQQLGEADSHEQRAQALRALLLARKMKQPSASAEHTGQQIRHWLSEMAPYSLYSALVLTRTLCALVQRSVLYISCYLLLDTSCN
jgi:hypothetical protein